VRDRRPRQGPGWSGHGSSVRQARPAPGIRQRRECRRLETNCDGKSTDRERRIEGEHPLYDDPCFINAFSADERGGQEEVTDIESRVRLNGSARRFTGLVESTGREIRNCEGVVGQVVQGIEGTEAKRLSGPFNRAFRLSQQRQDEGAAAERKDVGAAQRESAVENIKSRGMVVFIQRHDKAGDSQCRRIVAPIRYRRPRMTRTDHHQ
jgi:hypothetical protein